MDSVKLLAGPMHIPAGASYIILTCGGGGAVIFDIVRHIHVCNDSTSNTFSLGLSNTDASPPAGQEIVSGMTLAANGIWDWYGRLKLLYATWHYLVGVTAGTMTVMIEGEQTVI